jgi:hypothetical protein
MSVMLADEGGDGAADRGDAEADPIDVGAGHLHDRPGDALVEALLDDGDRQHQRAHDEQHRIGHQALRYLGRIDLEEDHLADDDEQRHGGQRHRLGDKEDGRHHRHRQHDLAFLGEALGRRRDHQQEADQHRYEEPAPGPEEIEIDILAYNQIALVAATLEAGQPLARFMRLQAVARKGESGSRLRHSTALAEGLWRMRDCMVSRFGKLSFRFCR